MRKKKSRVRRKNSQVGKKKRRKLLDSSLDAIDYVQDKVSDLSDDAEHAIRNKATQLRAKADKVVRDKVNEGKVDDTTVGMATGAARIAYGVIRGGLAVLGILGHGVAGYFMRNHNPRGAVKLVEDGFDAAKENIGEGVELFKDALDQRRRK